MFGDRNTDKGLESVRVGVVTYTHGAFSHYIHTILYSMWQHDVRDH